MAKPPSRKSPAGTSSRGGKPPQKRAPITGTTPPATKPQPRAVKPQPASQPAPRPPTRAQIAKAYLEKTQPRAKFAGQNPIKKRELTPAVLQQIYLRGYVARGPPTNVARPMRTEATAPAGETPTSSSRLRRPFIGGRRTEGRASTHETLAPDFIRQREATEKAIESAYRELKKHHEVREAGHMLDLDALLTHTGGLTRPAPLEILGNRIAVIHQHLAKGEIIAAAKIFDALGSQFRGEIERAPREEGPKEKTMADMAREMEAQKRNVSIFTRLRQMVTGLFTRSSKRETSKKKRVPTEPTIDAEKALAILREFRGVQGAFQRSHPDTKLALTANVTSMLDHVSAAKADEIAGEMRSLREAAERNEIADPNAAIKDLTSKLLAARAKEIQKK